MNWKSISFRPDDKRFVFVIFRFHFHYFNGHFHFQYVRYISSSAFEILMRINKVFQHVYWCLKLKRVLENFQVNHSIYHKHTQNFVFLIKISREKKNFTKYVSISSSWIETHNFFFTHFFFLISFYFIYYRKSNGHRWCERSMASEASPKFNLQKYGLTVLRITAKLSVKRNMHLEQNRLRF